MDKVRMEIEERRKKQARKIMEAIEVGMMKRLRAKEEEIEKIGKLNWALEERVKSLCVENQIWRDLAQTNEATANALRTNLEQVLAQVKDERTRGPGFLEDDADNENDDVNAGAGPMGAVLADDAQSCCGENDGLEAEAEAAVEVARGEWRSLATADRNDGRNCVVELETTTSNVVARCSSSTGGYNRWCRNCGKEESCVLLLPCRHLCLCTVCGSSLHTCPICKSTKNASVHVNMS
ncbi:E3 ubiquitin-protein ligase BOI [Parasponia andersonii]|uniref:RING-type E3 ubiquitin transferase n=1 Tax=Parasponia andersonii TaxID=3476 RepID=A0A2P5DV52_PARAD|nr:E3 ubiquitin-protein ligase BOI [Parasponia andersonii]